MSSCSARFCEKIELRAREYVDQVRQPLHHLVPLAKLARVVEVGEVAMRQACVGLHERGYYMRIDCVADVALAAQLEHVREARALGDRNGRCEVGTVPVLVSYVLNEQHEQDVVLVLARVHAAAEFVAGGP